MGYGGGDFGGADVGYTGLGGEDGGGSTCCQTRRSRLAVSALLVVACVAGAALLLVLVPQTRAVCDGADSVNRGEQRACRPPRTADVALVLARGLGDARGIAAYRYASAALPPTALRTTRRVHTDTVEPGGYAWHDFALAAGGTVAFRYVLGRTADVYLMDRAQFGRFRARHARDALWAARGTLEAAAAYTAPAAGVYALVVDNTRARGLVSADETVTVTTRVHNVSRATAREACTAACTFRDVTSNETVIVEYTGSDDSVPASLRSGRPHPETLVVVAAVIGSVVAAVAAVVFFASLFRWNPFTSVCALVCF